MKRGLRELPISVSGPAILFELVAFILHPLCSDAAIEENGVRCKARLISGKRTL